MTPAERLTLILTADLLLAITAASPFIGVLQARARLLEARHALDAEAVKVAALGTEVREL
jgi:hypothetical protein